MRRKTLTRALERVLTAALLLPAALALTVGLGGLLGGLGDAVGAAGCHRAAQMLGAAWGLALVSTTVLTALATLAGTNRRGPRRRRIGRGRRGDLEISTPLADRSEHGG